jgi:hypothetical protein
MSYPCLSKAQDLEAGLRVLQPAPGTQQVAACYVTIRSVELAAAEQLALGSVFAGSHRRKALLRRLSSAQAGTDNISSSAYYEVLIYGLRGRTV